MSEQPTFITEKEHEASEDNRKTRESAAGNNQGSSEGGQSNFDRSRAPVGRRHSEVSDSDSAVPEPIMVVDPRLICPSSLVDMPSYDYYQSSNYIEPTPCTENMVCGNLIGICHCIVWLMNSCFDCIWHCLGTCGQRLRARVQSTLSYVGYLLQSLCASLASYCPCRKTSKRQVSHQWTVKYAKNAAETENLMHETE